MTPVQLAAAIKAELGIEPEEVAGAVPVAQVAAKVMWVSCSSSAHPSPSYAREACREGTGSMLGVSADDKHCVTVDGKVVVGRRLHHPSWRAHRRHP